ncbi:MAG: phosphonate ABC transporter, permease protein PhnE [Defluviitaleaceae bacterium]|nr:phosphonate ABC transporter, permease protein PhnE [Defluviitaleaceae bacterium]
MIFPNNSPLLSVRGLRKTYDHKAYALDGVDLDVNAGEFVAVIGPSGAGKSTLVRCVNRLTEPTEGNITFDGELITGLCKPALRAARTKIGMVFQHHNLIARTPVCTNVLHGSLGGTPLYKSLFGAYDHADKKEALTLLETVGLTEQAQQRAETLSGGQMQRVGICRALMQRPKLLLADEPIASLDPASAAAVMDCLRQMVKERNLTCIVNLHQVSFAREYAARIVGLKEGRVVFDGPPEELTDEIIGYIYGDNHKTTESNKNAPARCVKQNRNVDQAFLETRGAWGNVARFLPYIAAFLLVFFSFRYINVNVLDVFAGFPNFARFFTANFLPPNVEYVGGNFSLVWARVLDTLLFAVVGTYISALLAFLLGILMSKEMNPLLPVRAAVRLVVSFLRNVPLLIWATVMMFIFGIGPMVGVMALVLATLGFLARSYTESMDEIAGTRLEALRSTGAGYWQVLFHGLVPAFIPAWINWTLFSFEINVRASAVLGMVGAGGLGFLINTNLDLRGFRRAMALVLILMAMVLATEIVTNLLRKRLAKQGRYKGNILSKWLMPVTAIVVFFASAHRLDLNLPQFISRLQNAGHVFSRFWAFNPSALPEILRQLMVSAAIGVCALAVGCVVALVLAFLAAENITPFKPLGYGIKGMVSLIRAIPSLVLILMVVKSLGFGPTAAVVGLLFPTVGYLTRAFIGTIEEQGTDAINAMRATGAGRMQIICKGVLPGVFTAFVAWVAIRLESNIADSVSLGIVGAGGVGMLISRAVRQVNFPNLTTTIVVIFAAMYLIELGAVWLRRRIT